MADVVVFRRWRDTGDVIALFPEMSADLQGRYCNSYEHVGQHGAADYFGVIQDTRPVNKKQYAELAGELTVIGYNLRPVKRASWRHHERRRQMARHLATVDTDRIAGEN
jgi:hypothetical protein